MSSASACARPGQQRQRTESPDQGVAPGGTAVRGRHLCGDEDRPIDPDGIERAWYRPDGGALTLVGREPSKWLRTLSVNETFASIAAKIDAVDDIDWAWVEVLIGVPFRPVPSGGLAASDVWRRACAPWLRWVR